MGLKTVLVHPVSLSKTFLLLHYFSQYIYLHSSIMYFKEWNLVYFSPRAPPCHVALHQVL